MITRTHAGRTPHGQYRKRTLHLSLEHLEPRLPFASDVILEWNAEMLRANAHDHALVSPEQAGPILTARTFAIVSGAMYDAYNAIERIGTAYLLPVPPIRRAASDAAVAQAAHDVLSALYPSQASFFDTALQKTLDRVPDGPKEDRGRVWGAMVADIFLAVRAHDGADDVMHPGYEWNHKMGFHTADPLHPEQGYYASGAMHVTPFVVPSLDKFEASPLDDGTPEGRAKFLKSREYTAAYREVLALGGDGVISQTVRTPEQTEIGIFWGYDGRPGLGTPPRLYNQIARTVAEQEHNSEAENARLFALLNLAMADAGLTSWNNTYDDAFWRPIMGIRYGDEDGNPRTDGIEDWTPLGAPASNPRPGESNFTPPFPAYTSGHATFGAAAFQILARFYGRDDIAFTFTSDEFNGITHDASGAVRPLKPRSFSSFSEAKFENAQSRIYLGIHWAFDRDDGIRTGDQVANYVFNKALKPHGGHSVLPLARLITALFGLLDVGSASIGAVEPSASTSHSGARRPSTATNLSSSSVISPERSQLSGAEHARGDADEAATWVRSGASPAARNSSDDEAYWNQLWAAWDEH
ncbi:MAG: vanadium-dependent haloperoxidase [Pirellulaceae bacterium]